jgi:hypothetical protein
MESAQQYRKRAAHLRQLSSIESDVMLRQQLNLVALGYDDFAEQLEERKERCCADFGRRWLIVPLTT